MAWRFVTHTCGHQERINVDGPYVVVEQRVKNAERVSCPACIGIASRQRNRLDGFCELWGSKSQCDRAEPIRRRTLSQVDVLARHARVVPEKLRTLDRGRPWRDSQFASTRLSPSRDMSR